MRRVWAAVAALVLVVTIAAPAEAATPAPTPVVVGNQLVDQSTGEAFSAHGANWPGFEYACVQGWGYSGSYSPAEAAAIASWGINLIRLPLNQSCWLGLPGMSYGNAAGYRAAVQSWAAQLNAAGVAVLLDLHWSAPAGVAATGQRAMADAQSVTFWSSVAGTFKNSPSVMFDLFNEPYSRWNDATHSWAFQLTWDCWQSGGCAAPSVDDTQALTGATYAVAGMSSLVAAVRAAGASQPLWLGGLNYSNDLTGWLAHRPADDQLVASWHNYIGQGCDTLACWNSQIAPVAAVVPVVATEFGQNSSTTSAGYMEGFMTWADAHGVGYAPWAWWDVQLAEDRGNSIYALINPDFSPKAPNGTAYRTHLDALQPRSTTTIAVTTLPHGTFATKVTVSVTGITDPPGSVELYLGGTLLATRTLTAGTVTILAIGSSGSVTARYLGTATIPPSTSAAQPLQPLPVQPVSPGVPVVVGVDEPGGGGLVDDDRDPGVQLNGRAGERSRERALDCSGERLRLALAEREQHEVPGAQDGAEPLGYAVLRHVLRRGEEARVVASCLLGEGLHARQRGER